MKILDATTVIAIFSEINCPILIDKILRLGHDIVIPYHVINVELLDEFTLKTTRQMIKQGKIHVLKQNSLDEIKRFQKDSPGLGLGECDAMLSYQKLKCTTTKAYCILDDGKARTKATELGIKFTGLIGLLMMIRDRNIMNADDFGKIIKMLKDSNFRFPKDVVI